MLGYERYITQFRKVNSDFWQDSKYWQRYHFAEMQVLLEIKKPKVAAGRVFDRKIEQVVKVYFPPVDKSERSGKVMTMDQILLRLAELAFDYAGAETELKVARADDEAVVLIGSRNSKPFRAWQELIGLIKRHLLLTGKPLEISKAVGFLQEKFK